MPRILSILTALAFIPAACSSSSAPYSADGMIDSPPPRHSHVQITSAQENDYQDRPDSDGRKVPTETIRFPLKHDGDSDRTQFAEFELEIAADDASRTKGLSGRDQIKERGGMLFIYRRADYRRFWMYQCPADLDLIYLDAKGRIINWHEMKAESPRQPGESDWQYQSRLRRYPSKRPAQFVIELKAGWIEKLELKELQLIEFDREKWVEVAKRAEEGR